MAVDRSGRSSLFVRMLVSLGVISVVSLTIVLVAAAIVGATVFVAVAAAGFLASLYLLPFVDGLALGDVWRLPGPAVVALVLVIGLGLLPARYLRPVRAEIRSFEADLGRTGEPATERHPELAAATRRFARQADVPEPEVRIVNRRRPESYALADGDGGTIILTRGAVRRLTDDEREAVLAHEVSHLANGDGRLMRLLLVPLLLAERVGSADRPTLERVHALVVFTYPARLLGWALVTLVTRVQLTLCLLGVALLSREREFAADRGSAALTGAPASLASALETLEDARGRPTADLRDVARTAGALDILPPEANRRVCRPLRTHPAVDRRIERLEAMAAASGG